MKEEIIKITESDGTVTLYMEGFQKFIKTDYKHFSRPFEADFGHFTIDTHTVYSDTKQ